MPLVDLVNELLLEIVEFVLADTSNKICSIGLSSGNALSRIHPLSQTCKQLNDICCSQYFRQYRLSLRDNAASSRNEIRQQYFPEPGTISHALLKAPQIREIIISCGDLAAGRSGRYDDSTIESLLELVNSSSKLTSVTVCGDVLELPSRFWNALLRKPLRNLEIHNWASVAADLQVDVTQSLMLDKLVLSYNETTDKLLKAVQTQALSLKYADISSVPLSISPTGPHLRDIHIELLVPPELSVPILDFSMVPHSRVHVDVSLKVLSNLEVQSSLRKQLPLLFVEDLQRYNVWRKFDSSFMISRPSLTYYPKWKPTYQDNLEDGERSPVDVYSYWTNKMTQ